MDRKHDKISSLFELLPELRCPEKVTSTVLKSICSQDEDRPSLKELVLRYVHSRWSYVSAGATVLVFMMIIMYHPFKKSAEKSPNYSQEEILKAREAVKWSMTYTAQVIQKSERQVLEEAFTNHLPKTIRKCIKSAFPMLGGYER